MDHHSSSPPEETPKDLAAEVAQGFFGVGPDKQSRERAVRQWLLAMIACAVVIPLVFYLRFQEVGALGWGTTIFFVVYCLLAAIGFYFGPRAEYHTPVRLRGDWIDRVGAFWLVCCVFGPLLGWIITSAFPITITSWRWLYGLRVMLVVGLPVVTALVLMRYVRGKGALIALLLLVGITMLPVWSAMDVSRDLWQGPIVRQVQSTSRTELYLKYTDQSLGIVP